MEFMASKPGRAVLCALAIVSALTALSTGAHAQNLAKDNGAAVGDNQTRRPDPAVCATKFYTQEGNRDLVGNSLPIFFIGDAIKFPHMAATSKG